MNNLELIDTLIKEKKSSIDVHKNILEIDNSRRWFHNKMIKECEEHIEILFKIKSELEEYQKLKEKEIAKKAHISETILEDCKRALCPVCDNFTYYYRFKPQPTYCTYCGQRFRRDE